MQEEYELFTQKIRYFLSLKFDVASHTDHDPRSPSSRTDSDDNNQDDSNQNDNNKDDSNKMIIIKMIIIKIIVILQDKHL
jgi:hypothetical protein